MTGRRFAAMLTGLAGATTLIWASLGTIVPARSQEPPALEIRSLHRGTDRPPVLDGPVFLLVLGGDARTGNPETSLMDALHIIGVDPATGRAGILGIPRDSWVEIPGRGVERINAAGLYGGLDLVVDTVESVSGCVFDHALLVNFAGFRRLVDDIGGIRFDVPERLYEEGGSDIDLQPGLQTLNGEQALAWSRLRKTAARPQGDLSRSAAQNELIVAALDEARRDFKQAPGSLLRMLAAFRRNVRHDLTVEQMLQLGQALLRVDPDAIRHAVVDGAPQTIGDRQVIRITQQGAEQFVDLCGDGVLER